MKIIYFCVILGITNRMVDSNVLWGYDSKESLRILKLTISRSPEDKIYLRWLQLKATSQRNIKVTGEIGCRIKRKNDIDISPVHSITKLYIDNSMSEIFDWKRVINNPCLALINFDDNPIRKFSNDSQISVKHLTISPCNTRLESFPDTAVEAFELYSNSKQFIYKTGDSLNSRGTYNQKKNANFTTQSQSLVMFPMYLFGLLIVNKPSLSKEVMLLMASILFQSSSAAPLSDPNFVVAKANLHFESRSLRSLNDIDFNSYPGLTHLYLTNNSLTHLNISSDSLTFLKLDNNRLGQIRRDEFRDIPCLKDLSLAGNHLKEVVMDLDPVLPELRRLDLSRNGNLRRVVIKSQTLWELILADNTIDRLELETPKLKLLVMSNSYYNGGGLLDICKRHSEFTFSITYNRAEDAITSFYECVAKNDKHDELNLNLLFLCTGAGILNMLIIYLTVSTCVRKAAQIDTSSTENLCGEGTKRGRNDECLESETVQQLPASVWPPNVLGKML